MALPVSSRDTCPAVLFVWLECERAAGKRNQWGVPRQVNAAWTYFRDGSKIVPHSVSQLLSHQLLTCVSIIRKKMQLGERVLCCKWCIWSNKETNLTVLCALKTNFWILLYYIGIVAATSTSTQCWILFYSLLLLFTLHLHAKTVHHYYKIITLTPAGATVKFQAQNWLFSTLRSLIQH